MALARHILASLLIASLAFGPAVAAPGSPSAPIAQATPPSVGELARADDVDANALHVAYEDGYDRGLGVPLMVWGSVYMLMGGAILLVTAGVEDSDDTFIGTDFFTLIGLLIAGIGAAQLVPGALLFRDTAVDPNAPDEVRLAHDAGYDHGVGNALIGYGVVFALPVLLALGGDNDGAASGLLSNLLIAGLHLGLGIGYRISGTSEMEALLAQDAREHARTTWQPAARKTSVLPVFRVDF